MLAISRGVERWRLYMESVGRGTVEAMEYGDGVEEGNTMASDPLCLSYEPFLPITKRLATSHKLLIGERKTLANAKFLNGSLPVFICAASKTDNPLTENRLSADYQANLRIQDFLWTPTNHPGVETQQEKATKLEEKVRYIINRTNMEPLNLLEFIDDLQRLGLAYKFEEDIIGALQRIVSLQKLEEDDETHKSLYATALLFRICRQFGFDNSQDVFESFKDEEGNFKIEISDDIEGMLSLYEASHLTFEGESLWEAKAFCRTQLMNLINEGILETKMVEQVKHVLEGLPYHHSVDRLEARRYIEKYDNKEPHKCLLLELAKIDFNMVQSLHQQELHEMSRWWKDIGLANNLGFARDRLTESFFWSIGIAPEPQFTNCRKVLTKIAALVTVLDDVYDVYGTIDELELFTDAIERWDVNYATNTLPDYMKLCFLALYNTINEVAFYILKEKGVNSLPCLRKAWTDMFKAFLQEAKWSCNKVMPTFNEYLENAWISSSGVVCLIHSYFLLSQDITEEALHSLTNYHDLLRSSATIFRLTNDLATSREEMERGETINSITCYLGETNFSEEIVRDNLRTLIDKAWQNMNKCRVMNSMFPKPLIRASMNMARIAQCIYQYGDGFGRPDNRTKSRIKSLLLDPIPINLAI
ncbi:hypothetical protein RIF29_27342 [Crotalaria pallida]|uniref:Uncharacterized protein n=1 Tax=Crotalaria pallida TaxID=3830 RepID=A0AAN9I0Y3_CROPI